MSQATAAPLAPMPIDMSDQVTPVVLMDRDGRQNLDAYSQRHGLTTLDITRRFGASGIVRCGEALGSAQLTATNNLITTAAHVLYDRSGNLRGQDSGCTFEIEIGSERQIIPIDLTSITSGSTLPYSEPALKDWAVARLNYPAQNVTPYQFATAPHAQATIMLVAAKRERDGYKKSIEACHLRSITNEMNGLREVSFDCSAETGASGGAILNNKGRLVGIYVGDRTAYSGLAVPFSELHYNFGLITEGAFRATVQSMAGSSGVKSNPEVPEQR